LTGRPWGRLYEERFKRIAKKWIHVASLYRAYKQSKFALVG